MSRSCQMNKPKYIASDVVEDLFDKFDEYHQHEIEGKFMSGSKAFVCRLCGFHHNRRTCLNLTIQIKITLVKT
jgi:hypothetical protein